LLPFLGVHRVDIRIATPEIHAPVPHRGRRKKIIPGVRPGFARWEQPVKMAARMTAFPAVSNFHFNCPVAALSA
jgi:hypothetical protein